MEPAETHAPESPKPKHPKPDRLHIEMNSFLVSCDSASEPLTKNDWSHGAVFLGPVQASETQLILDQQKVWTEVDRNGQKYA